ncbi:MAG: hypothetical protein Q4B63_11305 [Clostridium perfringens]|nr:hypothetical protein [Clostridium perfringens]
MFENGIKGNKVFTIWGGADGVRKTTLRNRAGVQTYIIDLKELDYPSLKEKLKIKNKLIENFIYSDMSFGIESTLRGKIIFEKIKYLKGMGYEINLVFIYCKGQDNNFKKIENNIELFDTILFYDNTRGKYELIGFKNGDIIQELSPKSYMAQGLKLKLR